MLESPGWCLGQVGLLMLGFHHLVSLLGSEPRGTHQLACAFDPRLMCRVSKDCAFGVFEYRTPHQCPAPYCVFLEPAMLGPKRNQLVRTPPADGSAGVVFSSEECARLKSGLPGVPGSLSRRGGVTVVS